MTKVEKIKYLVCEYAKSFGIGSDEWRKIYIKQDRIVNKNNSKWNKSMIDTLYDEYTNGSKLIGEVFNTLDCLD